MARDAAAVLDVRQLTRSYGRLKRIPAVRGVSFVVHEGEIYGLIGPDGAGKTSIIQTLAGVLKPHGGRTLVQGLNVVTEARRITEQVGYMPQGLGSNLYDSLTVAENIEFFRDLRQLPAEIYEKNRAELLAMTRLAPFVDRRVSALSGGMRQKLALICTLIHLPSVLLLDEPTTGVDPISRQEFWQIIRRVVDERSTTVLVSTSYMDEAERCHRVALLHEGKLVAEGTPAAIMARATGRFARVVAEPHALARQVLKHREDVVSMDVYGEEIRLQLTGTLAQIERALTNQGVSIRTLTEVQPTLEDVFLQLLKETQQDAPTGHLETAAARSPAASVDCRAVSRRFGTFSAVDRVDLTVRKGEIFGLLGPNGAGKTTLIKMMCGLLEPTSGTIAIGGIDVRTERERIWTAIGYMSQRFSLYQDLTVQQNLQLYADLYGLDRSRYAHVMTWLGLEPFATRLTKALPSGVRQRVSLLCAVLHHPSVVFLDEPTSGVDPRARRVFWDLIDTLSREAGVTVLVSTHYMDEAAHCDRLGLMHQGRLIAEGSPAQLTQLAEQRAGRQLLVKAADVRRAHASVLRVEPRAVLFGEHIRVRTFTPDATRHILAGRLADDGLDNVTIEPAALSIEQAFVDFVEAAEPVHA